MNALRHPFAIYSAAVLFAFSLTACPASRKETGDKISVRSAPGTAVVIFSQEPDSLNPYLSPMAVVGAMAPLFYSGLVISDERGRWQPDLAERVPSIANGGVVIKKGAMRVTYRLRKGVRWHDGHPLTSDDVKATWRLIMDPRFPALSRSGFEEIRRIDTPDPHTAVLHFSRPYAPFAELFPFLLPAHLLTAAKGDFLRQSWNLAPVGTGPYRYEAWRSGDRVLAVANDDYFRGPPAIKRMDLRFIPSDATAYQMWRLGEADLLQGAPPATFDALQREAPERVHLTTSGTWEHLVFNLENPILSDLRVRRAVAHLIDRQQLNARAYSGVLQPAWSELTPAHWAFDARGVNAYPPDRRLAERLLTDAGWVMGVDGVRRKNGRRLALNLLTTTDKPSRSLAAQMWRRQWRDVGIELEIERWPPSQIFGVPRGRLAQGTFDLALLASLSRPDPDTTFRWRSDQVPPVGQNRSRYRERRVDGLLERGLRTVESSARKRIYHELAAQLRLDLPVIPLLYWVGLDATSPRLQGFRPNPTIRGNLWNTWEWKLEPS
ncbi:MAG: peptide ABC transporter substrate-binding protein [Candidatus Sericytochromatia bacterium]|nr:peptide ABC transporter substrate-binding protein [Candidatus Sericytochromatia bacterium]